MIGDCRKSQVERLYRLCLQLQASVSELHVLVEESQAIAGGRQTGELKKAVSRLTSTTTGSFYDPDSDPSADMWSASSEKKFYEKVDQCIDEHPLQAVQALEQRKAEFQNRAGWLWRMAKGHRLVALQTKDADKRKAELYKAIAFAERALAKKPSAEAHKWYGVSVGARSEFGTVQEKIKDGFTFKEHIDKAVKLNPKDPVLHHLLGRFNYEVSGLSWIERRAAAALFGSVPQSTTEEALQCLLKAEELSKKPWLENRYIIARCYIDDKKYKDAIKWIDKAVKCAVTSELDDAIIKEVKTLQAKYGSYRA
ncbi:Regulator of microtubule dynamics protein 2 [Amphibalanus amphitrite]|uniref:Regulator of microtubule dynamics protein 1 n=1 Tax=Amphibalanus amphitrite TaxID=1232801 RepID=A0A6A4V8M5_AMPAM|nr:Regulator of microtubule dynamics protein 2 [Amphibalanus amphitrite]